MVRPSLIYGKPHQHSVRLEHNWNSVLGQPIATTEPTHHGLLTLGDWLLSRPKAGQRSELRSRFVLADGGLGRKAVSVLTSLAPAEPLSLRSLGVLRCLPSLWTPPTLLPPRPGLIVEQRDPRWDGGQAPGLGGLGRGPSRAPEEHAVWEQQNREAPGREAKLQARRRWGALNEGGWEVGVREGP